MKSKGTDARTLGSSRPDLCLAAHAIHFDGGMERAFAELIIRLHKELDIAVVSSVLAPELRKLVRWRRLPNVRRPFPVRFLWFFLLANYLIGRTNARITCSMGAITLRRVDIASVHFCHAGRLTAAGRLSYGESHFFRRLYTAFGRLIALLAERWCFRFSRVCALTAVSEGLASELSTHYPGLPVTVVPNGVDSSRFHPDAVTHGQLRAELSLGPDAVVALFVGGDWDRKGLSIAIDAMSVPYKAGFDIHLWVVGRGDSASFARLAEDAGIGNRVHFFGQRKDTERFCQGADIFILPSLYETFSLVCFEAAASGLPLVITDISGARELVGKNEAGLIADRSGKAMGEALQRLVSDSSLRSELGRRAQERAQAYTWDKTAATFLEAIQPLMSSKANPSDAANNSID